MDGGLEGLQQMKVQLIANVADGIRLTTLTRLQNDLMSIPTSKGMLP